MTFFGKNIGRSRIFVLFRNFFFILRSGIRKKQLFGGPTYLCWVEEDPSRGPHFLPVGKEALNLRNDRSPPPEFSTIEYFNNIYSTFRNAVISPWTKNRLIRHPPPRLYPENCIAPIGALFQTNV